MRYFVILTLLLSSLLTALQAELTVTARFDPPRIALGDTARYVVEIRETDTRAQPRVEAVTSLPIPNAGGLNLRNGRTSRSQRTSIMNGAAEYSATQSLIIDASAARTGSYTIGAYEFTYKGQRLRAPAATLEVVERPEDAGPTRDELIFLRAELPDQLYVGQTIGFELQLLVSERAQLTELRGFERNSDSFIVSDLPERSGERSERINGERYTVLSWPLSLTPIQTGPQSITFQFELTAQLPDSGTRTSRDPFGMSPFGRGFFDDIFGRNESLNVFTDAIAIEVLPLPEKGRPASFTGAIGDFSIEVGVDSDEVRQGEPVMLSVQLKGRGNFSRIEGPRYAESPAWRIYDPETKFEAEDALGLRGSKRFDYLLLPKQSGKLAAPATEFSFFDPNGREYVTLTAPPITIEVTPAPIGQIPPSSPSAATARGDVSPSASQNPAPDSDLTRNLSAEEALLVLDYRRGAEGRLRNRAVQPTSLLTLNLAAAASLLLAAALLHRAKKHRTDPDYRRRLNARRASAQAVAAARQALASDDAERFYQEASHALRQALTARTGRPLQAAGPSEMSHALRHAGTSSDAVEALTQFMRAAEAHRFGGGSATDLRSAARLFESILKAL